MYGYWSLFVAFLALAAVAGQAHGGESTCPADSDCTDCSRESGADCQPEVSGCQSINDDSELENYQN